MGYSRGHMVRRLLVLTGAAARGASERCLSTHSTPRTCVVHLVGCGAVGRKFSQILQSALPHIVIGSVSDSSGTALTGGLSPATLNQLLAKKSEGLALTEAATGLE